MLMAFFHLKYEEENSWFLEKYSGVASLFLNYFEKTKEITK